MSKSDSRSTRSRDGRQAVLILGGGPAGLTAGLRVVKGGCSAVVVERRRYDESRIGEHLSPEGVSLVRSAGVSALDDGDHLRCGGVKAWWGEDTPRYMDYLFHPVGHGLNLSRHRFDANLAEQCRSAGATVHAGARLISIARTGRGWRAGVQCDDRIREYTPRVIVDATGRSAAFARLQGSAIDARDAQVGLIAFRASNPNVDPGIGRVMIESAEAGWWYFAALSRGRCVCMFTTDADLLLAATPGSPLDFWTTQIQRTLHVRSCVEQYPTLTRFIACPARSQRLNRMSGRGWIAVGDAAIAFDPLSSQGIAKGVEHGRQAADAVLAHLDGDDTALESLSARFATEFGDYEQKRRGYYSIEHRWPHAKFWVRRQLRAKH